MVSANLRLLALQEGEEAQACDEGVNVTELVNPCRGCGYDLGRTYENTCELCKWKPRVLVNDQSRLAVIPEARSDTRSVYVGDHYVGQVRLPRSYEEAKTYNIWDEVRWLLVGYKPPKESAA